MTWVSEEKDEIKNNKTENRVFRGCYHRQKRQKERFHQMMLVWNERKKKTEYEEKTNEIDANVKNYLNV